MTERKGELHPALFSLYENQWEKELQDGTLESWQDPQDVADRILNEFVEYDSTKRQLVSKPFYLVCERKSGRLFLPEIRNASGSGTRFYCVMSHEEVNKCLPEVDEEILNERLNDAVQEEIDEKQFPKDVYSEEIQTSLCEAIERHLAFRSG